MDEQAKLVQELKDNEAEVKRLEQEAVEHEKAARDCRAQREALKHRQTELRSLVGAISAHNASQEAAAAKTAAEAASQQCAATLKVLREKEAVLEELIAKATRKVAEPATA